jgi:hypothetical protein
VKKGKLLCGHVNGKNRLGGYVGWTPFIFDLETESFSTYEADVSWLYDLICLGKPLPPNRGR